MQRLIDLVERFGSPRVALVGDFMLDRYIYGDVERINPEAPVPVLRIARTQSRVGGTGNVAAALAALGAQARCVGVVGADPAGDELTALLQATGSDVGGLVRVARRQTCVKTRFVGLAQHRSPQQMLRVDDEPTEPLAAEVLAAVEGAVRAELPHAEVVVLEDYNKGIFGPQITPRLIADALAAGKRVIVDPANIADYAKYRGCSVIKPNRYEASVATGISISGEATLAEAAGKLVDIVEADAAVITLDRDGVYIYRRNGGGRLIPHHRPREVYDVSGAGDETLAVLAVALASGCDYVEAVQLANVAGGLEVQKLGFEPITRQEMVDELEGMIGLRGGKVMDRSALAAAVRRRRAKGQKVVFANGCFDLLHMGHVSYLQQARELGHCLVVAINSDDSVRRLKGPSRPIISQAERAAMLAALEWVDYVTIFDEDTPIPLLELLRPDMLVKGGTTPKVVGQELVEGYGGQVLTLAQVQGLSTTQIINRIMSAPEA
jgi:D-beta-D-heptose 7-phosphate kinase/D-beta-D-heptose 1-phosphate adenosyltransferase